MWKEQEYQNHGKAITQIYHKHGVILSEADREWIFSVFSVTAALDDKIDAWEDSSLSNKIIKTLSGEVNCKLEWVMKLRNSLLSHPDWEDRLVQFIRKVKLLFRCTQELSQIIQPSKYFKYSIIEWRLFWEMVALGVRDLRLQKLIWRAGWMENLTDDILDGVQDHKNWERSISPNIQFYIQWVSITVSEIINLWKSFGIKSSMKSILAALPTMWEKYILSQIREALSFPVGNFS